jgi:phosphinothricin acetyltransferase
MSPTFRDAVASDLSAITALYAREVEGGTATFETAPPTVTEMAQRLAAVRGHGLPWLVAERDGRFAGYAYASPFRPRPAYRYGVEVSIYVEEAARGCGIGRGLLLALIDRIRALGLRHLIGAISDSDTSAASIALHRSLGFRDAGVYRQVGWKFDRWLDVTLMQLDLDPAGGPPARPGLDLGGAPPGQAGDSGMR